MCKYSIKRSRHLSQIKCLDEQAGVPDLAAAAAAHEATKLFLGRSPSPRRLPLEASEGAEVSLSVDDVFDRGGTECADQLFLEIRDAHVETQLLHLRAREVEAEAGPLEAALEVPLLAGVIKARQPDVETLRAEPIQELADRLRASDRDNGDALSAEIPPAAFGESLERALVADPLDEHDATQVGAGDPHP